jgi:hypothetical protein
MLLQLLSACLSPCQHVPPAPFATPQASQAPCLLTFQPVRLSDSPYAFLTSCLPTCPHACPLNKPASCLPTCPPGCPRNLATRCLPTSQPVCTHAVQLLARPSKCSHVNSWIFYQIHTLWFGSLL